MNKIIYKEIFDKLDSLTIIPRYLHKNLAYLIYLYKLNYLKKKSFTKEILNCFDSLIEVLFNIFIGVFIIEDRKLFLKFKKKKHLIEKLFNNKTSKSLKNKIIKENLHLFLQPML